MQRDPSFSPLPFSAGASYHKPCTEESAWLAQVLDQAEQEHAQHGAPDVADPSALEGHNSDG
jgi:hypothetical protein